ncbi:hypothetical protein PVAP13_5NG646000 [Panicum virgatum]|uniref:Uncharacterized protein n=1 Tax=Panicum virgatum TaxID=38727 RepID=A0A8T0SAA9_PANVG|nr:hypothetical protein PVAP13_5NG646000 [Panicum virgatum]
MRQCIISGDSVMSFSLSNSLRRCALILMTCKDYVPAAAAMMGVMKEAESAIGLLRADQDLNNAKIACTDFVRHGTLLIMFDLCDECSAVAEPTVSDITGDLNSNELDNKLADNGNHEERGNVSENKNSKKELARKDGSNRTYEDQIPNEKLGRNSLDKGEGKLDNKGFFRRLVQKSKLTRWEAAMRMVLLLRRRSCLEKLVVPKRMLYFGETRKERQWNSKLMNNDAEFSSSR